MIAKENALFILAFCLAGGIINATGIFQPVDNMDADQANITGDMANDLMDIDEGSIASSSDISTSVDSWSLVLSTFGMVKDMLSVLLLPGPFLKGIGVNALFADAIQVIMNIGLAWGLIQFALNRSTKNFD